MTDLLLADVRPLGGAVQDVLVRGGRIAAIAPGLVADTPRLEGQGRLLLPAFVEAHTHADKTLWGLPWRPNTAGPTLRDYIENERRVLAEVTASTHERAGGLLRHLASLGSLAIRSHTDIHPDTGVASVEAMLGLKRELADLLDLQVVAFPQQGLLSRPGTEALMRRAAKLGIDALGGLDPAGIDNDSEGQLRFLFDLAGETGCGLDIHLHDRGTLGLWQLERIAAYTAERGLGGKVMVSHAYCLGEAGNTRLRGLADSFAKAGVAIMTTAPADGPAPPIKALRAAGVTVCSGNDGIRDAWSPLSTGDQLERAYLIALRFDFAADADLALALECVTGQAAKAIGLEGYGLEVGCRADLVLLPAETLGEAIVQRPRERTVIRRGRVLGKPT